jgi:hypothetical protein
VSWTVCWYFNRERICPSPKKGQKLLFVNHVVLSIIMATADPVLLFQDLPSMSSFCIRTICVMIRYRRLVHSS